MVSWLRLFCGGNAALRRTDALRGTYIDPAPAQRSSVAASGMVAGQGCDQIERSRLRIRCAWGRLLRFPLARCSSVDTSRELIDYKVSAISHARLRCRDVVSFVMRLPGADRPLGRHPAWARAAASSLPRRQTAAPPSPPCGTGRPAPATCTKAGAVAQCWGSPEGRPQRQLRREQPPARAPLLRRPRRT